MKPKLLGLCRRWWLALLAAAAAGISGLAAPERPPPGRPPPPLASMAAGEPIAWPATLLAREALAPRRVDPFAPRLWHRPAPPMPQIQAASEPSPPAPTVPPNAYRFAGTAHYAGKLKAVLIRDGRVHTVLAGETLDGVYRVLSVRRDAVTLLYTPLDIEQRMAFAEDAPGSASSPFPPGSPLAAR